MSVLRLSTVTNSCGAIHALNGVDLTVERGEAVGLMGDNGAIKFQAFLFSAFCASLASLLILGYSAPVINALGQSYELRVIGGANFLAGAGSAYGAVIGSALLEVIRNALLMAGIDSNWQGAFVGAFIILAVLIGMETRGVSLSELMRNMFRSGKGR